MFLRAGFERRALAVCATVMMLILPAAGALPAHSAEEKAEEPPTETAENGNAEPAATERGDPKTYEENVVVTASRNEADEFQLPYSVSVVTSDDIRSRKLSRTLPEVLREVPSVLVQKTAHGQGSPFIRGFTGFHTLLMIDGIRLNNSVFRSGPNQYWATVDPLSIGRLEVVKGPSSALYGSDAVGGTVNAVTAPALQTGDGFRISSAVHYRWASAEDAQVGHLEVSGGGNGRLGFFVRGSIKDFGDVTAGDGNGLLPNTGYDETDADARLEVAVDQDSRVVVAYQRVNQNDVPRTHKTIFSESFQGTTIGNERRRDMDQDRELFYVQYHTDRLGGAIDRAAFSLSYHSQEELRDRLKKPGSGGDLQGFDVGTTGLWAQLGSSTGIGVLTYGFEYYHDEVDSFKTKLDDAGNITGFGIQGPVADDAEYDLVGIYVQDEKPIGERAQLTAGLRYTHSSVEADRVDVGGVPTAFDDSWDNLVGNVRLMYRVGDRWNAFFGASQGFRAPNLSDLTKLDDTSAVEVPSLDLEPEEFLSFEVGAKNRNPRGATRVAYWYTLIDDLIVQSPTGVLINGTPEVRKDNIGDGYAHGVEIEARYSPVESWTLFGNVTWMDGEVDQLDESAGFTTTRAPLSRLMPLTGNIGLRYGPAGGRWWVEGLVGVVDRQDDLALRDRTDTSRIPPGGTPGYTIFTLRGGLDLAGPIKLTAAVENIGDKNYRVHGSGQNEPGTNFVLALEARY